MKRKIAPVTPGEMLEEEFLKPLGLTMHRLAEDVGVSPQRMRDIIAGKSPITEDEDLKFSLIWRTNKSHKHFLWLKTSAAINNDWFNN